MNKDLIITVVLVVLVVISVVQAVQLNTIKSKITVGGVSVAQPSSTQQTQQQAPIQNTPTMVGGC